MRLRWDLERIRKGCVISKYKLQNVSPYSLIKQIDKILGIRNSEIWLFDDVNKIIFPSVAWSLTKFVKLQRGNRHIFPFIFNKSEIGKACSGFARWHARTTDARRGNHEIKKGFNMNRNRIINQWSAEYAKDPCRSRLF